MSCLCLGWKASNMSVALRMKNLFYEVDVVLQFKVKMI